MPSKSVCWIVVAGILGPLWLAATVLILTIIQYDFMRGLGWHPLDHPTLDWPSGLALGPYGIFMTLAFLGCGLLLFFFGQGIAAIIPMKHTLVPRFMMLAGLAMTLLSFPTDPTLAAQPRTFSGYIHDTAFVLLGLSLFPALLLFARHCSRQAAWKYFGIYTWITLFCIIPAFILKGLAFYVFLIGILLWFVVLSLRIMAVECTPKEQ